MQGEVEVEEPEEDEHEEEEHAASPRNVGHNIYILAHQVGFLLCNTTTPMPHPHTPVSPYRSYRRITSEPCTSRLLVNLPEAESSSKDDVSIQVMILLNRS